MRAVPLSLKLADRRRHRPVHHARRAARGRHRVNDPATGIGLGDLTSGPPLIALGGIAVAIVLVARGVRGAIVLGVLAATALGLIFGVLDGPGRRRRRARLRATSRRSATRWSRPTSPTR